ncbi:tumor necrosis factor receptor superfamily member 9 [Sceloporus undulatus]|uniref:tumor necrosis factor receptor superfamily member 9 n=1 Tax=Sceloporus undulatus TaxID=8520 RepID=UPI001C4A8FC6|nr:tumor necrosis factor receptor superfamily member 9 [Sceloporus undulatus]
MRRRRGRGQGHGGDAGSGSPGRFLQSPLRDEGSAFLGEDSARSSAFLRICSSPLYAAFLKHRYSLRPKGPSARTRNPTAACPATSATKAGPTSPAATPPPTPSAAAPRGGPAGTTPACPARTRTSTRRAAPPGTEPSPRTGCQSCPEGAFNARSRSRDPCRPFSRCPDDRILKPGTKESDVVCQPEPTRPPIPTTGVSPIKTTAPPETDGQMVPIAMSVAALLLCLLALCLSCLVFRSWAQEKSQEGGSACHGQPAQEVDDCSYCYPEEEEGGDGCSKASGAKWELLLEKVP